MGPAAKVVSLILTTMMIISMNLMMSLVGATWCVARSNASPQQLQSALNYACANGANCRPIQPGGSCYQPNTIQNHASYAFDSYFRSKGGALGACNFGGVATIAVTNPSYGGCNYPMPLRTTAARGSDQATKKNGVALTPNTSKDYS